MTLIQMMSGRPQETDPVPPEVITCNFWLLATAPGDAAVSHAWYKPDGTQLPIVSQLKDWLANGGTEKASQAKVKPVSTSYINAAHPISHYLLLPNSEWGAAEQHLDAIRPFIKKYQPTIGFSPVEASHAKRVTVINGSTSFPESIIDGLLAAGCIVEQISGDGMNIASQ